MTREGALEEASSSKAPQEAKAEMGRSAGRREYAGGWEGVAAKVGHGSQAVLMDGWAGSGMAVSTWGQ